MNKAVRNTLILRITTLCSGGLSLIIVPYFLGIEQQGYYYTFLSLVSIQVFFELGLSQVLIYVFSAQEKIASSTSNEDLQAVTLSATKLFNKYAGIFFFILGNFLGLIFFKSGSLPQIVWQPPWILLVICTAINLSQTSKLTYLEATGKMSDVSAMRTYQDILGVFLLILALYFNAGLWAASSLALAKSIITNFWLYTNKASISWRNKLRNKKFAKRYLFKIWKNEIFPMQWKISISWVSGYFIFQFLTPLTFKVFGPSLAGQLGLTLNITTGILLASTTFTTARSPDLAKFVVDKDYKKLDKLFNRSFKQSIVTLSIINFLLPTSIYFASIIIPEVTARVLLPKFILMLCIASLAKGIVYCLSTYLRAHRDDPYMPLSIFTSILTIIAVLYFSNISFGAMLLSYLAVSAISLIVAIQIFKNYKNKYHKDA